MKEDPSDREAVVKRLKKKLRAAKNSHKITQKGLRKSEKQLKRSTSHLDTLRRKKKELYRNIREKKEVGKKREKRRKRHLV